MCLRYQELTVCIISEIPDWLRVYAKAPSEHDHKLKVFLTLFSSPGQSPGRAIVLPPGIGIGVGVGVGSGVGVSKMLKFLR